MTERIAAATALTGAQKAAVVLMNLSHENAARVMQQLSEGEAEEIAAAITQLRSVDRTITELALGEFHDMTVKGLMNARGGRDVAAGLLEASFGAERAAGVMSRVSSSMAGRSFEFLDGAEPSQIVTLLDGELSQTISLVLAHLRPERASAVLAGIPDPLRTDIAQSIATMGSAAPEAVAVVASTLRARAGALMSPRDHLEVVGGVQPLVEIINRADVSTERALLEGLETRDPALADEVRSRMLTFADIVKFERRDVQQVLRGIDPHVLAVAMKGSTSDVIETIRVNLTERNRELLDSETETLGPVRISQVQEARAEIVRVIRDLEAAGVITVQRGDEEEYVY